MASSVKTFSTSANTGSGISWTTDTNPSVDLDNLDQSKSLLLTNHSFAIPSGATINGITVSMERLCYGDNVKDVTLTLLKSSASVGDNKASLSVYYDSSGDDLPGLITYGGASDLWGVTWTDSEINNSGFGVLTKSENLGSFASLEVFGGANPKSTITVYYTEAVTGVKRYYIGGGPQIQITQ